MCCVLYLAVTVICCDTAIATLGHLFCEVRRPKIMAISSELEGVGCVLTHVLSFFLWIDHVCYCLGFNVRSFAQKRACDLALTANGSSANQGA